MVRVEVVKKGISAISDSSELLAEGRRLGEEIHKLETEYDKIKERNQRMRAGGADPAKIAQAHQELVLINRHLETAQNKLAELQQTSATSYDAVTLPGPKRDYQEWLLMVPFQKEAASGKDSERKKVSYKGSHWQEENVLVHIRVDTRDTEQGPTLFVNEIQSDWHQEGREKGYKGNEDDIKRRSETYKIEEVDISDKQKQGLFTKEAGYNYRDGKAYTVQRTSPDMWLAEDGRGFFETREAAETYVRETVQSNMPEHGPFSKTWTELALKKILLEAIAAGHKRITFATGEMNDLFQGVINEEQSAGRKKFYDEILWNKLRDVLKQAGVKEPKIEQTKFSHVSKETVEYDDMGDPTGRVLGNSLPKDLTAPTLVLSSADVEKIQTNGVPLFSPDRRASVTFLANGRAILNSLKNPDIGTLAHEIGHIIRRTFVDDRDHAALERLFGVKNSQWTVPQEEAFAQTFLRWIRGDKSQVQAVSPKHYTTFVRMEEILKDIFLSAHSLPGSIKPNAEFAGIMRRMLLEDTQPIKAAELFVTQKEAELENAKLAWAQAASSPSRKTGKPVGMVLADQAKKAVDQAKIDLRQAQLALRDTVDRVLVQGPEHPATKRAVELAWVERLAGGPMAIERFFQDEIGWSKLRGFLMEYGRARG